MKNETYAKRADEGATDVINQYPTRVWRSEKHGPVECRSFPSLREFADVAITVGNNAHSHYRDESNTDDWGGGINASTAYRMATVDGWEPAKPGVDGFTVDMSALTMAEREAHTFEYRNDVTGSVPDIGLYLSGEPECMMDSYPIVKPVKSFVVRIVVPFGYRADVEAEWARQRGTAIIGLLDALTAAGYSLEIWGVSAQFANKRGKQIRRAYAVKIHDAADIYDPKMIAFGTGHPAMHRKLRFLAAEHENYQATGKTVEPDLRDLPLEAQEGATIVLPLLTGSNMHTFATQEGTVAWITEQVTAILNGELVNTVDYEAEQAEWSEAR